VNFLDEAGVESFDARHCRTSFAFSPEKDETRPAKELARKPARNSRHHVESFLLCHRADDSTYHRAGRPAALPSPVARPFYLRRWNTGIDDLDSVSRNSCFHHHRFHRLGDGDESIDSVPILESHLLWRKYDATGHDQTRLSLSDKTYSGDGMRSRIVCMDDAGVPLARDSSQLARGPDVPLSPERKSIGREARLVGAPYER